MRCGRRPEPIRVQSQTPVPAVGQVNLPAAMCIPQPDARNERVDLGRSGRGSAVLHMSWVGGYAGGQSWLRKGGPGDPRDSGMGGHLVLSTFGAHGVLPRSQTPGVGVSGFGRREPQC
jgi:hypothetical protein